MARAKVQIKDKKTGKIYESMYSAGKELAKLLGGKKKGYDPESRLVWFSIARDFTDRFEYKDESTKGKFKPLAEREVAKKDKKAKPAKESEEDEKANAKARLAKKAKAAREEEEEEDDEEDEDEDEEEDDEEEEDEDSEDDEDEEEEEEEPAPKKGGKKLAANMKTPAGKKGKK